MTDPDAERSRDPFADPEPVPESFDPDAAPINAAAVEDHRDRILSAFDRGEDAVEEARTPPHDYRRLYGAARAGYLGAGYVWVVRPAETVPSPSVSMPGEATAEADRVLLLLERGDSRWSIPGGGREPPESFREAAVREVREETGVDCAVTGLYGLRHVVVDPELDEGAPPGPPIHLLYALFDGRYEGGEIAVQAAEAYGAAWFADLPDRLHPLTEGRGEEWERETAGGQ